MTTSATTTTMTTGRARNERTCAGCGDKAPAGELVRLVHGPGLTVAVDAAGGAFGRGAHVHPRPECLAKACKGGLARAFKANVKVSPEELGDAIGAAMDRRLEGLLVAASLGGGLAVGADAAREAMVKGRASLVVVARDAGSVADDREVVEQVSRGRAIAWGEKARLGALVGRGRSEVAVLVVTSKAERIAEEVKSAFARGDACRSRREVQ